VKSAELGTIMTVARFLVQVWVGGKTPFSAILG
jgi:hypothetical protein